MRYIWSVMELEIYIAPLNSFCVKYEIRRISYQLIKQRTVTGERYQWLAHTHMWHSVTDLRQRRCSVKLAASIDTAHRVHFSRTSNNTIDDWLLDWLSSLIAWSITWLFLESFELLIDLQSSRLNPALVETLIEIAPFAYLTKVLPCVWMMSCLLDWLIVTSLSTDWLSSIASTCCAWGGASIAVVLSVACP